MAIHQDVSKRVIESLKKFGPATTAQLRERLRLSTGSVSAALKYLRTKGVVKAQSGAVFGQYRYELVKEKK